LVENLENKIKDWLLEEQQTITKKKDPNADFLYEISKALGSRYTVSLAKIKERDLIQIIFTFNISDQIKKELVRKVKKKSSPLLSEINDVILMKGASFAFTPDLVNVKQISIIADVFPSELTKTSLFNGIKLAKDSGILVLFAISKHVDAEDTSTSEGTLSKGIG